MLQDVGKRTFRIENVVSAAVDSICGTERVFSHEGYLIFLNFSFSKFLYFSILYICIFCIFRIQFAAPKASSRTNFHFFLSIICFFGTNNVYLHR